MAIVKVAINGYGRIGRNILRALYENNYRDRIAIVAVNDLADPEVSAHLTKYDTVHGKFPKPVSFESGKFVVDGDHIPILSERDPANLPWADLKVDVVFECTGFFREGKKAAAHLQAGAKKVLISAPAKGKVDNTIVYGVNHQQLKASDQIVSNASCTTNCLAPLVKPLHEKLGVLRGMMVTTHAYTNDQVLIDVAHKDIRRARSATQSVIPTDTGAAKAIGLIIPELDGKLSGYALRVPLVNVSLVDLTFVAKRDTTVAEVDQIIKDAADGDLKGILAYNTDMLVSHDFNHNPASSIYDSTLTKVIGNLVKVSAWYDNEWGFSNRMLDTTLAMIEA
jgi:glyceraldehyde 3-phosphate dehydrogenase